MQTVSNDPVIDRGELFLKTGQLISVGGMLTGRLEASIGELVRVNVEGGGSVLGEVIGFQEELCQIMLFGGLENLKQRSVILGLNRRMRIPIGNGLLGRVINCIGEPIDGLGALPKSGSTELQFTTPDPLTRQPITEQFVTGIRAIDGVLSIGKGQRVGLFAGSGVGKSTLLGEIAKHSMSDINVVALIGERGREVLPFVQDVLGIEGMRRTVLIVSTSDQSALARVRASETAVAISSWFRSQGRNVLLMLDSITRLATAQRELGLMLGEPPTSRGFTPSVFQKMAQLLEQLGTSSKGSITALLTVLVDGDDMNEPVADAARSILDGHIVLDRKLAHRGHFPAIDILQSASRLAADVCSDEHLAATIQAKQILALYTEVEDLIQIGAYKKGAMPKTDAAIDSIPSLNQFLQQTVNRPSALPETLKQLHQLAAGFAGATYES